MSYGTARPSTLEQGRHEGREEMRSELTPPKAYGFDGRRLY